MNTELLLLIIVTFSVIGGVGRIILGALGVEKDKTYGFADVLMGLLELGLIAWVMLT